MDYIDINFDYNSMNYSIISLTGDLIKSGVATLDENRIFVEELSAGYYLMVLDNKSETYYSVEKLIIYD